MENIITTPKVAKKEHKLTVHNDTRIDNYYWLNDRNNKDVINYLNSENEYLDKSLAHTKDLQSKIYDEIVGRIEPTDLSVPFVDNGYTYSTKFEEGKEYPIYSRSKLGSDQNELLIDVNELAKGQDYLAVTSLSVSPNNRYLSFGVDNVSRRIYTIWIKDLKTGKILEEKIGNTTGLGVWSNDNNTLFYTLKDDMLRSYKTMAHMLGSKISADREIYEEKDTTYRSQVYKTRSSKYLVIGSFSTLSTEYRILDANTPDGTFKVFNEREKDHEYIIAHQGNQFYILSNKDALNFKLMSCPDDQTSEKNWSEVMAHDPNVLLEEIECFDNFSALLQRKNGLSQISIINKDGSTFEIPFEEEAYMCYFSKNANYHSEMLRLGYTSLTTPNTILDFDITSKVKTTQKVQNVVGDFSSDDYVSKRIKVKSEDGTMIPISLVYRKDSYTEGTPMPLLQYAYGSYGHSIDPYFSSPRLSLLDRGFVFAIAHIRGGQEMGRNWYEDGKLLKKKNTFTDFIDCSKALIESGITSADKLYAMGGSAGGLLMGAIINMAPKLYNGIISAVPFVDVVTTMLDDTIPLTTFEYDEWGNPNDATFYKYMKSYSPYDNVVNQDYPSMLVTTGLHDSQVQYWEPAKWVAKLRELKTDNNILLLHTNMTTGHGGASGRFEKYKETALEYAFLIDLAQKKGKLQ